MEQCKFNRSWCMYLRYLILAISHICDIRAEDVCQVYQTRLNEKYICPQITSTLVLDNITEPQCVTYCMYKECGVISFNAFEEICLLDKTPCHLLQPNNFFTIQIKRHKPDHSCINWLSFNGLIPDRSIQDASERMVVVAVRFARNGNLLPAKYEVGSNRVYSVLDGVGIEEASSSNMEFLVVDPLCSTVWTAYHSSGSEPLPRNAVMAGQKADGTPLYSARMWISIPEATEFSYGYYDPKTKRGYCHLWSAHEKTVMDVLCIAW